MCPKGIFLRETGDGAWDGSGGQRSEVGGLKRKQRPPPFISRNAPCPASAPLGPGPRNGRGAEWDFIVCRHEKRFHGGDFGYRHLRSVRCVGCVWRQARGPKRGFLAMCVIPTRRDSRCLKLFEKQTMFVILYEEGITTGPMTLILACTLKGAFLFPLQTACTNDVPSVFDRRPPMARRSSPSQDDRQTCGILHKTCHEQKNTKDLSTLSRTFLIRNRHTAKYGRSR